MIFYSNMPGIYIFQLKIIHKQRERDRGGEREQIEPEIKCKKREEIINEQ